jgi:hypothetical protein
MALGEDADAVPLSLDAENTSLERLGRARYSHIRLAGWDLSGVGPGLCEAH